MRVAAGTRFGSYEVVAQIGAGGMGEVYSAHDTKLGRDVAIKVLPETFAHDADRLSRFQREAKLLAALNHSNIATIYGLEQANGTSYLVMELVSGETLADRIHREGASPIEEALPIAKQIAEALEAAHEKGIIHRDLKPANVKVTPEGKVKVLDFGLAKAFAGDGTAEDPSNSPTLSAMATVQGVILGTAAYMSPEQARGKTVDKRTDIWAFGCVLYEMLTGQQAFQGEDITEILAAVVKTAPEWNRLPENTPPAIQTLLRRCLRKDRHDRLSDAGAVRIEIEDMLAAPKDIPAARPGTASKRNVLWGVAAGLAIITAVGSWAIWHETRPNEQGLQPLVRLDVDLGSDVSLASPYGPNAIFSPDGAHLAFLSQGKLFARRLDQPKAMGLEGTEGAYAPFFSPDGKWIAFFAQGRLKKISVDGGATIALCDAGAGRGGSWGEDGKIIAALTDVGGLSQVPSEGGTPMPATTPDSGEVTHRWPQILPGGKAVLFTANAASAGFNGANIEAISLKDRQRKTLVRGGTFGRYLPSGHLVYVNGGTLFAVAFDPDRLELRGTPVPLLDGVSSSAVTGSAQIDFSQNGMFLYQSGETDAGGLLTVQWMDSEGKTRPLFGKPGPYLRPRLSPDGERLALEIPEGTDHDVWIYELQRDTLTRLTFGTGGSAAAPVWSLDGRYIAFQGREGLLLTRSDGGGKPLPLTQSKNLQTAFSFAPGGKRLTYNEQTPNHGFSLWTIPLESDSTGLRAGKPELFLQDAFDNRHPMFSPDGRWLAYTSNESGDYQVYVRSFPDNGGKWQISNEGGAYPVWSHNGRELFFRSNGNRIMVAAYTVKGDSFVADKPRVWSEKRIADFGTVGVANYDLAPDGKRIVALMPAETAQGQQAQNHVIFLINFFDELRRRVPAGTK